MIYIWMLVRKALSFRREGKLQGFGAHLHLQTKQQEKSIVERLIQIFTRNLLLIV